MRAPTLMNIILLRTIELELLWLRELGGIGTGTQEIEEDDIARVRGDVVVAVDDGGGWGGADAEDTVGGRAADTEGFEDVFAEFGEGDGGGVLGELLDFAPEFGVFFAQPEVEHHCELLVQSVKSSCRGEEVEDCGNVME